MSPTNKIMPLKYVRPYAVCSSCGQKKIKGPKGKCNGCYKREDWRPARGPAVRREDRLRQLKAIGTEPGAQSRKYAKCQRCGSFKSRPSSECARCGDNPVTVGGDPYAYDRAAGWD